LRASTSYCWLCDTDEDLERNCGGQNGDHHHEEFVPERHRTMGSGAITFGCAGQSRFNFALLLQCRISAAPKPLRPSIRTDQHIYRTVRLFFTPFSSRRRVLPKKKKTCQPSDWPHLHRSPCARRPEPLTALGLGELASLPISVHSALPMLRISKSCCARFDPYFH
jgi:hypothetical protein